jgi:alkylation response protein AidB-like acyl-CoA dehydrogenase
VIGSFQGVKHTLADLATVLEPCRALVWFAAHAQDALPEEARLAALQAKAHLDDVGREVARLATEVHGGMGFTDLQGLHYWFKRIDQQAAAQDTEQCRHEAAVVQGWISPRPQSIVRTQISDIQTNHEHQIVTHPRGGQVCPA